MRQNRVKNIVVKADDVLNRKHVAMLLESLVIVLHSDSKQKKIVVCVPDVKKHNLCIEQPSGLPEWNMNQRIETAILRAT